jgi:hypothetical protein
VIDEKTIAGVPAAENPSFEALYAELNAVIQAFGEARLEKLAVHLRLPQTDSAVLRFYSSVSWMYVAIVEAGGVTIRFLIDRAQSLGIDPQFELASFRSAVHALRTLFQHGLDQSERKDAATLALASRWMAVACECEERPGDYFWPRGQADWETLALRFRVNAESFLLKCLEVVRHIESDESRESTIQEWATRCSLSLASHVFDRLIAEAVKQLGLPFLDKTRIRNAHIQKWNERLRLLDPTADLVCEARRLVDDTLLREWQNYCPLNGDDIIEHFQIAPGPKVRELAGSTSSAAR